MRYFCGQESGISAANIPDMNTQEIITPIGKFIEWTFETVLVPISAGFNWAVIAFGFVAIAFWLRLQKKFSAKAKQEGTIM
jgi:hypothetical protein